MNRDDHGPEGGPLASRGFIAAAVFLGIAAFFLLFEHRAHVLGVLPYLLLLACPLLHLFHHGGHSGHGRQTDGRSERESAQPDPTRRWEG